MVVLQAFSAFGVFLMRQFYMGIPDSLCEAARIDGMSEFKILYQYHAASVQAGTGNIDNIHICCDME